MPSILRTILAVVAGFVVGSVVNMGLIMAGGQVIPPPPGADVSTMEGLKASIHLFESRHFVFPFLAHSLGTLVGALVATLVVQGRSAVPGYIVGVLFLCGGIANCFLIPGPMWFNVLDLLAYLPAAWIGIALARRMRPAPNAAA